MLTSAEQLNLKLNTLWDRTAEEIDRLRESYGFDHDDPEFKKAVITWFGDETWDAWTDWYDEGQD